MEVVGFSVILQGNVTFQRAIADSRLFSFGFFVELYVHDVFTVEVHLKVYPLQVTIILFHSPGFFDMFLVGPTVRIMPP